ncbi:DNA-binding MarR family transcriptional regulator [Microbacterium terrae]|uniref:Transcriptional repressor MprA n=1 Tax=Microbacterium terrae TaxID=69369 RepID=A0A0M2HGM1_9MICO|nr:MarR family transcriptional regulator [Microbacterium terrae]KJL43907.1 Transcriptional repressor MprA [Microbacterium terrae]MBP1078684.1 DNA-binding MarR family transcriptional regulator [Microbacterium terrae]GLJ98085.1 MarR family transcriptional regulator [Microbacterium terrae]
MPQSSEASELSAAHLEVWASVATLLERLPAALDAQLQRDSGLTHFEHGLLFALDTASERTLRMSTLAGYASSTLSRLSRAISRLEKKGWVRREVDPTDGRVTLAVLTDAGHDAVRHSTPAHHALVEKLVFNSLTEQQVRQLGAISGRIAQAIDSAPAWSPESRQTSSP